ncbi:MAG: DUF4178 domain-containing protein [Cyanobacteria bacterium P01_A01_bin.45]
MVWLGFIVVVVIGVTLFVLQQQGKLPGSSSQKELPSLQRNIFNLQIGDIVQYMDRDWVVEGKLTYNDDGYSWFEYLLQDDNDIRWLSVDEDDVVEVSFLEPTTQLEVSQTPPDKITFNNDTYRCVESGTAKMSRQGTTLRRLAQRCQYFDYESTNQKVLSIEVWEGEVEVTVGHQINPRSLSLLPGDGGRVYGV